MSPKAAARLAWGLLAFALAMVAATVLLVAMNWSRISEFNDLQPIEIVLGITFTIVGAIVAARSPGNRIGWIFLWIGVLSVIPGLTRQYYVRTLADPSLPGGDWAAWLYNWSVTPVFPAGLALFLFLLFPDGHLPSRRWRVLAWMAIVVTVLLAVAAIFTPAPIYVSDELPVVTNPVGIAGLPWLDNISEFGWLPAIGLLGASAVAMGLRLRRSVGEERQQLKLFAAAGVLTVGGVITSILLYFPFPNEPEWVFQAVIVIGFGFAIPIAFAVAILKHGLYDIDVVINKTVVVGLLAVFIAVVYVGLVVGVGALFRESSNAGTFLSVVATAVIALAFQPVRAWARRMADRVVYGKRATPYEVLSQFSERMAGAYPVDDILPTMARVMGEGTGAARADVWLCVGTTLRRTASWTPGAGTATDDAAPAAEIPELVLHDGDLPPMHGSTLAVPVRHQGDLLGALSLVKSQSEPLTHAEDTLVKDLAAQAGLVMRNARLNAELRLRLDELQASRQRIVAAQDQARRRLERNIHDGAQQQLVAMAVKLRLANQLTARDPDRAGQLLEELSGEMVQALNDLRDLARGIYPPLLSDQGLVAALDARARAAPFPVAVDSGGIRRYPQDVEAAVYFCCLEALQNAAKYSEASSVTITLDCGEDWLSFEVRDDGLGFDPAAASLGTGLTNMADRVEALGGTLEIESSPGHGTCLKARIPVHALVEAGAPDADDVPLVATPSST